MQRSLAPLNLAAYVTWAAVTAAALDWPAIWLGQQREILGAVALLAVLALLIWGTRSNALDHTQRHWVPVAEGVLILLADWLLRGGQTGVLLIVVAAQLVWTAPIRLAVAYLVVFNAVLLWNWWHITGDFPARLLDLVPLLGFQGFAAFTSHYARSSLLQSEQLAQVNAELSATQRLLEESARTGERLKLSRELHDVAGHKLTALKFTLARLQREAVHADDADLALCSRLADELLADIRGVVSALRQHDGLELGSALRALAQPLIHTRVDMDIQPDLRADTVTQAEALVRCAQEAITNAIRHGHARRIGVHCHREGTDLVLTVSNDGLVPDRIAFGNGLNGMRERLQALGGSVLVSCAPDSGLRLSARLPASGA